MLSNLKKIQSYIDDEQYLNHPGKESDAYYSGNIDIEDCDVIATEIDNNGFTIIKVKNKSLLSIMRTLPKILGKQIRDVGINKKYIAKIKASTNGRFYINTSFSQPMHTDEGYRKVFPRYVSLYCVRPSLTGGISTLIKVKELLSALYTRFGEEGVSNLFQPSFIQIDTPSGLIDKQILFKVDENITGLSYSPILRDIKATALGYEIISFINQFIHDASNQYRVKLKEKDLLIMDNCRVLHGRTAFDGNDNRLLIRLWNDLVI